jgi:hypothetical protein
VSLGRERIAGSLRGVDWRIGKCFEWIGLLRIIGEGLVMTLL